MAARRSKATLPTLFSIVIIDLIGFGIVMPILPYYADSFGASATTLGFLLAAHAAMQFIFSPIWGRVSDRIGRRPVMLFTVLGTSVALLMLGLAPSLPWLFVARLLSGMFAANISVATAYLSDVTERDERTRWMGMIGASFGIGFTIGPGLGALLVGFGLGVPMFVAAGFAAVNFIYAAIVLKEPERRDESDEPQEHSTSRFAGLRNPAIARLTAINLLFSLAVTQLESIFAFFMMHRFDFGPADFAKVLFGMALLMALIQGGGIRALAARFGERNMLFAGFSLMTVGFIAIPDMGTVAMLLIPLLISAVGRSIAQPPMMSWVSVLAPENDRGSVMGVYQSASSLARVFGPVMAGLLYDTRVDLPFYLAGGLSLVAVTLIVGLRSPPPSES